MTSKTSSDRRWVVYTFNEPSGAVFYIGSGRDDRPIKNFRDCERGVASIKLNDRFAEIIRAGARPTWTIVSEHDTAHEARAAKAALIARHQPSGRLVNQITKTWVGNISPRLRAG